MERTFDTPEPIGLYVEIGAGSVTVDAGDTNSTRVRVTGDDADEVEVAQDGGKITVIAPRRTGFLSRRNQHLDVRVTLPADSQVATRTGSADLTVTGPIAELRTKSGSGEVQVETINGPAAVETGSGDVKVGTVEGALQFKSGSGDVEIDNAGGDAAISTGSGDISIGRSGAHLVGKSGSGDVRIREAHADLTVNTGSGDISVELFHAGGLHTKTASGDVRVGVPSGIPVWTDVSAVTGRVSSTLEGAGQPSAGDPYLELRITTVSGDIVLDQR